MNKNRIDIVSKKQKRNTVIVLVVVAILYVVSVINLNLELNFTIDYLKNAGNILFRMLHLDFSEWQDVLSAGFTSLAVAALATIVSAIFAFFISFFAATNVSNGVVASLIKGIAAWIRAVPTLIWTLIFVAFLGLGPFPGVLGLSFHSFAYLLKAFSQSIEEVRPESIEAIRATGASWLMIMSHAVVPGITTAMISWIALRFEINVAESTILGFVGAGGIGHEISSTMRGFQFEKAGFVILVVFIMSFSIEMLFRRLKLNVDKTVYK